MLLCWFLLIVWLVIFHCITLTRLRCQCCFCTTKRVQVLLLLSVFQDKFWSVQLYYSLWRLWGLRLLYYSSSFNSSSLEICLNFLPSLKLLSSALFSFHPACQISLYTTLWISLWWSQSISSVLVATLPSCSLVHCALSQSWIKQYVQPASGDLEMRILSYRSALLWLPLITYFYL